MLVQLSLTDREGRGLVWESCWIGVGSGREHSTAVLRTHAAVRLAAAKGSDVGGRGEGDGRGVEERERDRKNETAAYSATDISLWEGTLSCVEGAPPVPVPEIL